MLAAVSLSSIALGIGAGGLAASLIGTVLTFAFDGSEWVFSYGIILGWAVGLGLGGWMAGRRAPHSGRFHGAITGLLLAGLVVLTSQREVSEVDAFGLFGLYALSAAISAVSGSIAHARIRRRQLNLPH